MCVNFEKGRARQHPNISESSNHLCDDERGGQLGNVNFRDVFLLGWKERGF